MSMAIILKKQPENIMKKRNLRRKRNSLKYVLCIFLEFPSVFLENKAQSHFFMIDVDIILALMLMMWF